MHFTSIFSLTQFILLISPVPAQVAHHAIAIISSTANSTVSGFMTLEWSGGRTLLSIALSGLQPNQKVGLHIHAFGDVSSPDGSNAYGHFNPTNASHGCVNSTVLDAKYANGGSIPAILPINFHVGDIGNIRADALGNVKTRATSTLVSLRANDPGFVLGRGIIVHAQPDDCATQPTGNAGRRLGQGVIGWRINGTTTPATFSIADPSPKSAIAVMTPASGSTATGVLLFSQKGPNEQVSIQLAIWGVAPSTVHGLHIHAFGDTSDISGNNTGGHFNPFNTAHGCFANTTRHAGDLDNVKSDATGIISIVVNSNLLSLYNGAPNFILGRGVILHSAPDDCRTQPTGNAGARLSQGVIGYHNITSNVVIGIPSSLDATNSVTISSTISSTILSTISPTISSESTTSPSTSPTTSTLASSTLASSTASSTSTSMTTVSNSLSTTSVQASPATSTTTISSTTSTSLSTTITPTGQSTTTRDDASNLVPVTTTPPVLTNQSLSSSTVGIAPVVSTWAPILPVPSSLNGAPTVSQVTVPLFATVAPIGWDSGRISSSIAISSTSPVPVTLSSNPVLVMPSHGNDGLTPLVPHLTPNDTLPFLNAPNTSIITESSPYPTNSFTPNSGGIATMCSFSLAPILFALLAFVL